MTVDQYIQKHERWADSLTRLRKLVLTAPLEETVKWGAPVYAYRDKNVLSIGAFKNHFSIWFFQGVLLKDPKGLLQNAQEGKTQAMRQIKFNDAKDIDDEAVIALVLEAVENQKKGKTVKIEKKPLVVPDELKEAISRDTELAEAFENLTLGKKRDYAEHIETAKREETRLARLEKIIPMIKQGIGLNDKYKNC